MRIRILVHLVLHTAMPPWYSLEAGPQNQHCNVFFLFFITKNLENSSGEVLFPNSVGCFLVISWEDLSHSIFFKLFRFLNRRKWSCLLVLHSGASCGVQM
ncbi:hypothetical protein XENORESO_003062 [Xenotaenia resolanae]|uniref:Secreted protein n=1 Tax=Xenotaenia resolanae TaxID=208358 RepID=A0ABV0X282_9TELE